MDYKNDLIKSITKSPTTKLGKERIKNNLSLKNNNIVDWCKEKITNPNSMITRKGKNWYITRDNFIITVNASGYTIITAHKKDKSI